MGRYLLPALALLALSGAAAASPPRAEPIASYCSPSGDLCYGVVNRSGAVYLELATAARYFGRYRLCVRLLNAAGAAGAERCGSFPLFRDIGSTWRSRVKYARQFPALGRGTYRVTWKLGSRPLGPALRFRLPL